MPSNRLVAYSHVFVIGLHEQFVLASFVLPQFVTKDANPALNSSLVGFRSGAQATNDSAC